VATSPRVALVIGNSQYALGALRNPVNDATDMAAALQRVGFTVTRLLDADRAEMETSVKTLTQQLRQNPTTVGLFYFAGHGALVESQNYLLPVRAAFDTQTDVKYHAVAAEWVLERMEATGNALNLLILDACRNNPFARQWRSGEQGLGNMNPGLSKQTLIAFATLPGKVAADLSTGRNSPYTTHLLQHLGTPGLEVGQLFRRVRADVERDTQGTQTPQEWTTLKGTFHFVDAPPLPPARDPEEAAWQVVEQSTDPEDVKAFLEVYGQGGRFAPAARLKLRQLARPAPAPQAAASVPPVSAPPQVAVNVPPASTTSSGKTLRNSLGMEFVLIPAGEFQMGSHDKGAWDAEKPVHPVRLTRPFYLGKYEVTQAQWLAVMGSNPSRFTGDANRPVENVSWEEAQEFIRRLNAREGGTPYRLPTEAEWEYAARAGSTTAYSFGEDTGQLGDYAWYEKNAGGTTHPVGQKRPNAWGLYDMHGNVWEWVQDWYARDAYRQQVTALRAAVPTAGVTAERTAALAVLDPAGPAAGSDRVLRGGGWIGDAGLCRSAYRSLVDPGDRDGDLGLRLLRTAP
jgi:formylglycine-generating enzyme required for sulfatase activity